MSRVKELDYFTAELNWAKGLDWYMSNFIGEAKIYGEASPSYTNYPFYQGVPQRMHSLVPEARLIYLVRDPLERIISHYLQSRDVGYENRPLAEALNPIDIGNRYAAQCRYYLQLEQYLEFFPRSRILVVTAEDLQNHRRRTLAGIFRFLDVDDSFFSPRFFFKWNETRFKLGKTGTGLRLTHSSVMKKLDMLPFEVRGAVKKLIFLPFSSRPATPALNERIKLELIQFLQEDINKLREFTGYNLKGWSV